MSETQNLPDGRTRPDRATVLAARQARKLAKQNRRRLGDSIAPAPCAPLCGVPSHKLDPHHDSRVLVEATLHSTSPSGSFSKLIIHPDVIEMDPLLANGIVELPWQVLDALGINDGQSMDFVSNSGGLLAVRMVVGSRDGVYTHPLTHAQLTHAPPLIAPSTRGVGIELRRS